MEPYKRNAPFPEPSITCLSESSEPFSFPPWSLYQDRCFISKAFFDMSYVVLSTGALPPGSPHRGPKERDYPFIEHSFTLEVPSKQTPLQVPQWGSYGEGCPFLEPSCTYPSGSLVKEPFLLAHFAEFSYREMLHFQRPPSSVSQIPG